MGNNRVAITGLGVVSSMGLSVNEWWKNLIKGESKIGILDWLQLGDEITPLGAEVKNFDFEKLFDQADLYKDYLDKSMEFGFVAAKEAYDDAQLGSYRHLIDPDRFGVYIGSTTGGIVSAFGDAEKFVATNEPSSVDYNIIYKFPPGSWSALLAHYFNACGPSKSVGTSCYAGGESVGTCYRDIKDGLLDVAIVGGLDAPIIVTNYLSFYLIGATSKWQGNPSEGCRPFSKDREGMVFGEGAAFFVLENLESALKRNAKIYAEIVGYSATSDGDNMVHPSEEGIRYGNAISQALNEAGIAADQIAYVSCHGTGTQANDKAEVKAIKNALGEHSYELCISSIKSMIGHSFGGATALEILGLVKSLQTKIAPPTANYHIQDPECDLDCVPIRARKLKNCSYVLKTATGFGGSNMAMIIKNWDGKGVCIA